MRLREIICETPDEKAAFMRRMVDPMGMGFHNDIKLPEETVNFLWSLYQAYRRNGGQMLFKQCIEHLRFNTSEPKKDSHQRRYVFWSDSIIVALITDFHEFIVSHPQIVRALGYHIARDDGSVIFFEKIKTESIPAPAMLWHVTLSTLVPTILRQGLRPARQARDDLGHDYAQPRIYLTTDRRTIQVILRRFRDSDKLQDRRRDYTILAVDPRKIDAEMHNDTQFSTRGRAVYVTKPIPATAIAVA